MKALWMIPLALACANKGIGSGVDPSPSWASPDGRAQAKIELAEALVLNGTPEAALQMISQMVEQGIRHPDLYVLQGRALTDMGLDHEAEVALSAAARRSPGNAEAHNRLGILYLDQSRTTEAVKRFKSAAQPFSSTPLHGTTCAITILVLEHLSAKHFTRSPLARASANLRLPSSSTLWSRSSRNLMPALVMKK